MDFQEALLTIPGCYAVHICEESLRGFVEWTRRYPGFFTREFNRWRFWAGNFAFMTYVVGGVLAARRRDDLGVTLGLSTAAWIFVNALVFHVFTTIDSKAYSPGLVTALVLYIPCFINVFRIARREGLLSTRRVFVAFSIAITVMFGPIVFRRPCFQRDRRWPESGDPVPSG